MKNRIITLTIFLLSIFLFITSLDKGKSYYYNYQGNSLFQRGKYEEAREKYRLSFEIKESEEIKNNIVKAFYEEKKYKEVVENPSSEYFLRGNSFAFLGDEVAKTNLEEAIKNYKSSLEEYKNSMKISNDINIKKNYEIVLKKIEELEKQQQENNQQNNEQKNQDQKDNEKQKENKEQQNSNNSENSQENREQDQKNGSQENSGQQEKQDKKDNGNQQNSSDEQKQNESQENNKDKENKQTSQENNQRDGEEKNKEQSEDNSKGDNQQQNQSEEKKDRDSNQKENSKIPTGEVQPIDEKPNGREEEIGVILKRLEGNEKQSFKNNERMINVDTGNSNRW